MKNDVLKWKRYKKNCGAIYWYAKTPIGSLALQTHIPYRDYHISVCCEDIKNNESKLIEAKRLAVGVLKRKSDDLNEFVKQNNMDKLKWKRFKHPNGLLYYSVITPIGAVRVELIGVDPKASKYKVAMCDEVVFEGKLCLQCAKAMAVAILLKKQKDLNYIFEWLPGVYYKGKNAVAIDGLKKINDNKTKER